MAKDEELTQYEKERLERIARNQAMLATLKIGEVSAEFVAPLKAAQQQAQAKRKAIQNSFTAEGPVRRSGRAAAAATRAKLSQQPHAQSDSHGSSQELSDEEDASGSEDGKQQIEQDVYDPTEEAAALLGRAASEDDESEPDQPSDADAQVLPCSTGVQDACSDSDQDADMQRALAQSLADSKGNMNQSKSSGAANIADNAQKGQADGADTSSRRKSNKQLVQHEDGKGKPVANKAKARAAPKRKRKSGQAQSLAGTEDEIKSSFALLHPTAARMLNIHSLQRVVSEVLGERLDAEDAADMVAFANEMGGASGDDISFSTYMQLAKHIVA